MPGSSFPTFARWLTTFERGPRRWRISPPWHVDRWAAQQRSLLRMLAAAADERLPPAPLVARLMDDHRGRYRWALARLARRLEEGTPLADALEQTPGVLSPGATLAVRFGAQSGTLAPALDSMVARDRATTAQFIDRLDQTVGYFTGIVLIACLITGFILIKIIPSFQEIFADFGLETPLAFQWLVALGRLVQEFWWIAALAGLALAALLFTQRGWSYFHRVWLARLSRSASKLRGADVLNLLAVAQRAGRPLSGALSTLARYHYDPRIRSQLLFARNEVEQGAELWGSMAGAGMLTRGESQALQLAPSNAARAWTMDRLAEVRRGQVAKRIETLIDLLHPALVLLMAAGVLLVAVATLSPLIDLINGLGG